MTFHSIRFPEDISYGSRGGPTYSTDVIAMVSGHEQRNSNWAEARARYNVAHGVKSQEQLDALLAFFRARKGRAYGFRFKDWTDYSFTGQVIGTGDGVETQFQLCKHYESGGIFEERPITKPIANSIRIYVDGIAQIEGWSVDDETGIVMFDTAPAAGVVIAADGEFDVPVRFDTDQLSATLDDYGVRSWSDISLVEIRN